MSKRVWVTHVSTESGDEYFMASSERPAEAEVIRKCWQYEGECEDLEFYEDTTSVYTKEVVLDSGELVPYG